MSSIRPSDDALPAAVPHSPGCRRAAHHNPSLARLSTRCAPQSFVRPVFDALRATILQSPGFRRAARDSPSFARLSTRCPPQSFIRQVVDALPPTIPHSLGCRPAARHNPSFSRLSTRCAPQSFIRPDGDAPRATIPHSLGCRRVPRPSNRHSSGCRRASHHSPHPRTPAARTFRSPLDALIRPPPIGATMPSRPFATEVRSLLDFLCTRYGLCLPPTDKRRLQQHPPTTPDDFLAEVYRAEGLTNFSDLALRREILAVVRYSFRHCATNQHEITDRDEEEQISALPPPFDPPQRRGLSSSTLRVDRPPRPRVRRRK